MRLSLTAAVAATALLSACVAPVAPVVVTPPPVTPPVVTPLPTISDATRTTARRVVNLEMAKRLPGRNVAPYTDCVISNATMAEVTDLAGMSGRAGAADAVAVIVKRPATSQCIARVATA